MKKRIIALGILSFMAITTILPFLMYDKKHNKIVKNHVEKETGTVSIEENTNNTVSMPQEPVTEEQTTDYWENLINQMNEEVANIPYNFDDMQQKQQWFLAYKEIIAKYPKELHMTTIYETYSEKELDLLFRIVQSEVGDEWDFDEKANVVSVIFNRLNSGKYNSLTQVLTAKNQFSPYSSGKYLKVTVDEKTVLACEYVFLFGDTTGGCYGFQMKKIEGWNGWEWAFSDDTHHFYRRKEN